MAPFTHSCAPRKFGALATWCRSQTASCRRNQAKCEAELRDFCAHRPAFAHRANPPRERTLRSLIATYRRQAERWAAFATAYSLKTSEAGSDGGAQNRL